MQLGTVSLSTNSAFPALTEIFSLRGSTSCFKIFYPLREKFSTGSYKCVPNRAFDYTKNNVVDLC
jgi:hypothetical protein